jgi:MFS family permease
MLGERLGTHFDLELALTAARIEMALFMTLMESTIVSTSVVTITNDLGGYVKSSWLFTSYMLTFSGQKYPEGL